MLCSICDEPLQLLHRNGVCAACASACRSCSHYVCRCKGSIDVGNAVRGRILRALQEDGWLTYTVPPLRCIQWWRYSWQQGLRLYHLNHWLEKWYRRRARDSRAEAEAHIRNIAASLCMHLRPTPRWWCHTILCLTHAELNPDIIDVVCDML